MLARPEFNTREDILLWLSGKPRDEIFYWADTQNCACGQYARERGMSRVWNGHHYWAQIGGIIWKLNSLAAKVATGWRGTGKFGALYDLAEREL